MDLRTDRTGFSERVAMLFPGILTQNLTMYSNMALDLAAKDGLGSIMGNQYV